MTSPRPIAHRAFTILLACLLVGGLVAPIVSAEPAAAQEDTSAFDCSLSYSVVFPGTCVQTSDDPVSGTTEVDLHTISVSEWESYESHHVNFENYLDDMETIAYIDARNTIADEWENGSTEDEAYQASRGEVRDYYAAQQQNHLQVFQKTMSQHRYTAEASISDPEISDDFLSSVSTGQTITGSGDNAADYFAQGDVTAAEGSTNGTVELVNGSSASYETMNVELWAQTENTETRESSTVVPLDPFAWEYDSTNDRYLSPENVTVPIEGESYSWHGKLYSPLHLVTMNVGEDLESQRVWDTRDWLDLWNQIEQQSSSATAAFSQEQVSGIYAGLESGEINVSDLRTAEGQVRHMSGDANTQSGAYQLALYENLDLNGPDLSNVSTMRVSYEGSTQMDLAMDGNQRVKQYSSPVNETYEGILYASETPTGGFVSGESYHTSNLSGSVKMVPFDNESVTFYDGTFTIEAMYDSDGNEVETADWDSPEPDSYSSDDFVEYINTASETRDQMQDDGDGGGDGISVPNPFDGMESGGAIVGLVIIVAGAAVAVIVVIRP